MHHANVNSRNGVWGQWELSTLSSQLFCKFETLLKSKIHPERCRLTESPLWKNTAQSLVSTPWAPFVTLAGHTLPQPGTTWQPCHPSQECFFPSIKASSGPRKNPSLLLHLWVDLHLKDLFSGACTPVAISFHLSGGRALGRAFHHQTLGALRRKSLALTLGTSPGHFDVVFWPVLGPVSLLLCPGLYCMFFPRLRRP